MDAQESRRIIEALLFASENPLTVEQIREVLGEGGAAAIRQWIEELRHGYREAHRAFTIEEVAGGFQMATDPQLAPWLRKLYKEERSDRLSGAALETLAIIAYRQPLTRAEIERIRGVNVDGVMRTLLEKGVIKILGRKEVPGRPLIYGTTKEFLQYFGLNSLVDLPSLDELTKPPSPTPGVGQTAPAPSGPEAQAEDARVSSAPEDTAIPAAAPAPPQ